MDHPIFNLTICKNTPIKTKVPKIKNSDNLEKFL